MAQEHVSTILKQLSAIIADEQELSKVKGLKDAMRELQTHLLRIQSVLDADMEWQLLVEYGRAAQALDEVLYDIEDLLDGINTEEFQVDAVEKLHPSMGISIGESMLPFRTAPTSPLTKVRNLNLYLNLVQRKLTTVFPRSLAFKRSKGSSFVEVSKLYSLDEVVSKLYGLDEVQKEITDVLLGDASKESSENIKTISIVGMEGMGKTTLAQCICNDDQVLANFENIIWVNVSESFDLAKIARTIIQVLEGLEHDYLCLLTLAPLQSLLDRIHRKIVKKKSLLVLDDVEIYHDDDWEALRALFQQGMSGSRILVTARKRSVAEAMESSHVFHLKELSDELCWMILRGVAFVGLNEGSHGNVEDIGRKLAVRCKG